MSRRLQEHVVPMPPGLSEKIQRVAQEFLRPEVVCLQVWKDAETMTVYHSEDALESELQKDDSLAARVRNCPRMLECDVEDGHPSDLLLKSYLMAAKERKTPAGFLTRSVQDLHYWLGVEPYLGILDARHESEDFCLMGLAGFVDTTLPDKLIVLASCDNSRDPREMLRPYERAITLSVIMRMSFEVPEQSEQNSTLLSGWAKKNG